MCVFAWIRRWLIAGALIVLLSFSLTAQTTIESLSDTFHSATLDTARWVVGKVHAQGAATPSLEGLQLTLTPRNVNSFFGLDVWLNCRIPGEFDAQVSYRLVDWPFASGIRVGLGVHPKPLPLGSTSLHGTTADASGGILTAISARASIKSQADPEPLFSGGEFYIAETNGRENRPVNTSDRSGKLRINRVKNEIVAWYWDPGSRVWIPTGRLSLNSDINKDEWIALELWGYNDSPNVKVILENFSISAQTLTCP